MTLVSRQSNCYALNVRRKDLGAARRHADLHLAERVDEDVFRLDVSMDNVVPVQRGEAGRDLHLQRNGRDARC